MDISKLPYRNNVACVVFKGNKFLLVHCPDHPDKWWKFPQGGIEKGETDEQTAKRELLEEIGSDKFKIIAKSHFTNTYDWPEDFLKEINFKWRGQIQRFFLVEFLGEENEIKIDGKEISAFKWVNQKDLETCFDLENQNYKVYKEVIFKILAEFKDLFPPPL